MASIAADVTALARSDPAFYEATKRNLRRNFALFVADGAAFGVVLAIFSEQTMLPNYLGIVSPTPVLFGVLATFWAIGRYVPQLVGSYLATGRHKRKRLLLTLAAIERLGLLLIAGSTLLAGRVPDTLASAAFLGAVLFFSVSLGLYMPVAQDFQAKTIVIHRGLLFGMSQLLGGGFGFITGLAASRTLGDSASVASFGQLFLVAFAISGLSLIALSFLAEVPLPRVAPRPLLREFLLAVPAAIREVPSYSRFLLSRATIAMGTMGLGFVAAQALEVGIAARHVALFSSAFVLSQAITGLGWGAVGERVGFKAVMVGGGFALATGLALAWASTSTALFAVAFIFLGGNNSALLISNPNLTFEMAPPERTVKYLGITNSVTGPSYILAALIGAVVASVFSYRHAIAAAAVIAVFGSLVALRTVQEPRSAAVSDPDPLAQERG